LRESIGESSGRIRVLDGRANLEEVLMAATKAQGKSFTLFMVSATVTAAGIAFVATAAGKLALVVGLVGLAISAVYFFKIKPEEGKPASSAQPLVLKLGGLLASLLGWVVILVGLHAVSSVNGRLAITIAGLAISLVGVLGLLPAASRKNAIWKA
jgi:uncharacterized membrane protein